MPDFHPTRRSLLAGAAAFTALPLLNHSTMAGNGLTLAFIPQENPEKLLGDIAKISTFLSKQIGVPVKGFVTFDHAAAVEALRNGDADISFMGALPFVLAEAEINAIPLLSEVYRGATTYRGRVFVRRDSGITNLEGLRGKDIAFADPISESGYLFPLDLFIQAGLVSEPSKAEAFFRRTYFAGGYQQAMQAMASGLVDAATASQYADLLLTPEQQADVIWLEETAPLPSHVVIARPGLDSKVQALFIDAMMSLNEPENAAYLKYVYGPDGYAIADLKAFEPVRAAAKRYGFLN